jgi:aromatic-L-amino-acid decarboxylase
LIKRTLTGPNPQLLEEILRMTQRAPFYLSHDEMQALGAQALDLVIHHVETNRANPVAVTLTRAQTERLLRTGLPETATPVRELVEILARDVFPNALKSDHPRFYAFVPSPTNFVSVIGDLLISGHNLFAGHWMAASAAAQIEINVIDWLNELVGFPVKLGGGILVSGGSMANLSAIATARDAKLGGPNEKAIVYCSDQTHSSMAKGLRMLGFRPEQKRTIETDEGFRLSVPALEAAIAGDRAAGRVPFCVVANGGTTNTGAVDPLGAIADVCARENLWLHVDGAYGAAAAITDRGRAALAGMERADSITLDPHKWLFQPYELGCLLVRDSSTLQRAFRMEDEDHADYLEDVTRWVKNDVNFFECGIQLTRSFKALKLWLSMRAFGLGEFRRAIEIGFEMADHAERTLRSAGTWEIVTPSQMGVVTFRWRDASKTAAQIDTITKETVDLMREDGYALVMSTSLRGRPVLRMCPINPSTNSDEIEETIRRLGAFSGEVGAKG